MDKSKLKSFKGITLIALIVTIIVILILAGIAVSMVAGNNGVLTRTTDAKKANEKGIEEDRMRLAVQSALIDGEGTIDLTKHTENNVSVGLEKALKEEFGEGANSPYTTYEEGQITLSNGSKYSVTTTGSVTEIKAQWTWTDNQAEGEGHGVISVGDIITSKKKNIRTILCNRC